MKKIIIFLIIFLSCLFINIKQTYASSSFYQAEYIPNIYLNKYNPNDNLIYYHQARMIRQTSTNKLAYCLEPFNDLNNNDNYITTDTPNKYESQMEYISLLAYFGYGYKNHTEPKWYAITQMLIWQVTNPNSKYYYTSTAKGEKITFTQEENEIQELIKNYQKNTSFNNQTYTIVAGNKLYLIDENQVLQNYKVLDESIKTFDNSLETEQLKTGTYEVILEKQATYYDKPILFYISDNNQDVVTIGKPSKKTNKFTVNVIETELNIYKLDFDNNSSVPQGEALIEKTVLSLYTHENIFIQDITLDKSGFIQLKNLNFGTYYIKEKKPGKGYTLNKDKYIFTLSEENIKKTIKIKNKVIKGKLIIKKEYGTTNNFMPEANISFNIYNINDNLIKTITTNEEGIAEISLPYGKYKIIQLTTTEGYQKVAPIEFEIKNNNEVITQELKNYKIKVPNTKTNSLLQIIINILKELIWLKK